MGTAETLAALQARHQDKVSKRARRPAPMAGRVALLAAAAAAFGTEPFTREQLAIAAWRAEPALFGMRGYETHHPDSHRVYSYLYGVRGVVQRGEVVPVGATMFQLSLEYLEARK